MADAYEVVWTNHAAEDLESVIDFIAQRNPERAIELKKRVHQRVGALAHYPFRSRLVPELAFIGLDIYRELLLAPYRVLLRIRGRKVIILGFFDGRRDLEDVLFERLLF